VVRGCWGRGGRQAGKLGDLGGVPDMQHLHIHTSMHTVHIQVRPQAPRLLELLTWLSMPSMSSMEKNRMAHSGDTGSWVTASG